MNVIILISNERQSLLFCYPLLLYEKWGFFFSPKKEADATSQSCAPSFVKNLLLQPLFFFAQLFLEMAQVSFFLILSLLFLIFFLWMFPFALCVFFVLSSKTPRVLKLVSDQRFMQCCKFRGFHLSLFFGFGHQKIFFSSFVFFFPPGMKCLKICLNMCCIQCYFKFCESHFDPPRYICFFDPMVFCMLSFFFFPGSPRQKRNCSHQRKMNLLLKKSVSHPLLSLRLIWHCSLRFPLSHQNLSQNHALSLWIDLFCLNQRFVSLVQIFFLRRFRVVICLFFFFLFTDG